jgi:hypothetical protein
MPVSRSLWFWKRQFLSPTRRVSWPGRLAASWRKARQRRSERGMHAWPPNSLVPDSTRKLRFWRNHVCIQLQQQSWSNVLTSSSRLPRNFEACQRWVRSLTIQKERFACGSCEAWPDPWNSIPTTVYWWIIWYDRERRDHMHRRTFCIIVRCVRGGPENWRTHGHPSPAV